MNNISQLITRGVIIVTLGLSAWAQYATMNSMNEISVSTTGFSSGARQAESDFQSETASDTTVYQQQVSASWGIKDMTHAVADELSRTNAISAAILWSQNITNWLLAALVSLVGLFVLSRKPDTKAEAKPAPARKPKVTE